MDSLSAIILGRRGIAVVPFVAEGELVTALSGGEVDAAAITPAAIGWYNKVHPQTPIRTIPVFSDNPDLNWNLAVGMIGADDSLWRRGAGQHAGRWHGGAHLRPLRRRPAPAGVNALATGPLTALMGDLMGELLGGSDV
jgi:hypothetical protein